MSHNPAPVAGTDSKGTGGSDVIDAVYQYLTKNAGKSTLWLLNNLPPEAARLEVPSPQAGLRHLKGIVKTMPGTLNRATCLPLREGPVPEVVAGDTEGAMLHLWRIIGYDWSEIVGRVPEAEPMSPAAQTNANGHVGQPNVWQPGPYAASGHARKAWHKKRGAFSMKVQRFHTQFGIMELRNGGDGPVTRRKRKTPQVPKGPAKSDKHRVLKLTDEQLLFGVWWKIYDDGTMGQPWIPTKKEEPQPDGWVHQRFPLPQPKELNPRLKSILNDIGRQIPTLADLSQTLRDSIGLKLDASATSDPGKSTGQTPTGPAQPVSDGLGALATTTRNRSKRQKVSPQRKVSATTSSAQQQQIPSMASGPASQAVAPAGLAPRANNYQLPPPVPSQMFQPAPPVTGYRGPLNPPMHFNPARLPPPGLGYNGLYHPPLSFNSGRLPTSGFVHAGPPHPSTSHGQPQLQLPVLRYVRAQNMPSYNLPPQQQFPQHMYNGVARPPMLYVPALPQFPVGAMAPPQHMNWSAAQLPNAPPQGQHVPNTMFSPRSHASLNSLVSSSPPLYQAPVTVAQDLEIGQPSRVQALDDSHRDSVTAHAQVAGDISDTGAQEAGALESPLSPSSQPANVEPLEDLQQGSATLLEADPGASTDGNGLLHLGDSPSVESSGLPSEELETLLDDPEIRELLGIPIPE